MGSAAATFNDSNTPDADALAAALKALDDIGRSGLAIAPLEPTRAMVDAGLKAGGVSEAQILAIYFAMLAAASDE